MNKKLVVGIIAGIALLLAIVIAIFAVTGSFSFTKPDSGKTPGKTDSSDIASSTVDKEGNTEFTVETQDAKKDSIVSIPILIKNNPGFYAGEFSITYDSDTLSYVDYKSGEIVDTYDFSPTDGKIKFMAYNSALEDVKKDGTLVTLNFKVLKENDKGEYAITIQKEGTMLGNLDVQTVKADILVGNGEVTTK